MAVKSGVPKYNSFLFATMSTAAPVVADDADYADDAVVDDGESSNHVVQLDDVAVKSGVPKYNSFLFATMATAFDGSDDFNEVVTGVAADVQAIAIQAIANQLDVVFCVDVLVAAAQDENLNLTQRLKESEDKNEALLAENAALLAKNAALLAQNKALDNDNDDRRGDVAHLSLRLKNAEKALKHQRKRARQQNGSDDSSDESESGIQERIQKAVEEALRFNRAIHYDQVARDARQRRAVESASLWEHESASL